MAPVEDRDLAVDEAVAESVDTRVRGAGIGVAAPALVLADLLAVTVSFFLAFSIRADLGARGIIFDPLEPGLELYLSQWPVIFIWPFVFWRAGLYPGLWLTPDDELRRIVEGSTVASLIVVTLTFVTKTGPEFSRPIVVGWWLLTLVLVPFHHVGTKLILSMFGARGPRCVVLGTGDLAERIIISLRKQFVPAVYPVAVFGERTNGGGLAGVPIAGELSEAAEWASRRAIDTALVVLPDTENETLVELTERLSRVFRRVFMIPDLLGLTTVDTGVRDLEGVLALEIRRHLFSRRNQLVKRTMDILATVALSLIALPAAGLIAVALALEGEGGVLYGHERLGKGGKEFTAWKFRTMVREADRVLERALAQDEALREEWQARHKLSRDPRLTLIGRILRRLSLDELPQLWNVLRGEMSLVGPRPIVEAEVPKYGGAYDLYKQVLPGLTGLWQVSGRSDLSYEERVRLDAYYVRNWSIWLDLVILLRTFLVVLVGRGAY